MKYKNIYFIGIGGIGMSALARWFKHKGCYVAGYDLTETELTRNLNNENIEITYNDDPTLIPDNIKKSPQNTLIIYTPAIPEENNIYSYFKYNNFEIKKRAEILGYISQEYFVIAVAGTHGKTTISTLIAHILTHTGHGCNAFLGGISLNYNSNLILSDKKIMIIEADEYDKSFLNLSPNIAIITAIDSDHLDIYGNYNNLKETFVQFVKKIKTDGILIINEKIKHIFPETASGTISYSLNNKNSTLTAGHVKYSQNYSKFDLKNADHEIVDIQIPLLGDYNIENALAAIAVAKALNIDDRKIKEALINYKGIKRRGQNIINTDKTVFIDDYAHHPAEIDALLQSIKTNYPEKSITVIFQPHLYSRTKDLAKEFAKSLSEADNIILLNIYPAREQAVPGVTYKTIAKYINKKSYFANDVNEILILLKKLKPRILLSVGAGDIYKHIDDIKELINNGYS